MKSVALDLAATFFRTRLENQTKIKTETIKPRTKERTEGKGKKNVPRLVSSGRRKRHVRVAVETVVLIPRWKRGAIFF